MYFLIFFYDCILIHKNLANINKIKNIEIKTINSILHERIEKFKKYLPSFFELYNIPNL